MTQQEFAHLSTRIRGKLVALARKFNRAAGTGDEAEDIAQEALVTLWELSGKGYPIRDVEALAVRLTKNICVNHYRKRKLQFQPLEEGYQAGYAPVTGQLEEEDIERIRKRLYGKLSETQRAFLTMRNDFCLSLDEIAAATGRPKNSIKVALSNARRQMLDELKKIQ
jgi:RNA polymerase sigma-70 factor (ECF subfamily)